MWPCKYVLSDILFFVIIIELFTCDLSPLRAALKVIMVQASLLEENIKPRTDLPPLLVPLRERRPEKLHYLAVSFGLTLDLFRFWRKHNFAPFYIGHVPVRLQRFHFWVVWFSFPSIQYLFFSQCFIDYISF